MRNIGIDHGLTPEAVVGNVFGQMSGMANCRSKRWAGDRPLPDPMVFNLLKSLCDTRPQRVKDGVTATELYYFLGRELPEICKAESW